MTTKSPVSTQTNSCLINISPPLRPSLPFPTVSSPSLLIFFPYHPPSLLLILFPSVSLRLSPLPPFLLVSFPFRTVSYPVSSLPPTVSYPSCCSVSFPYPPSLGFLLFSPSLFCFFPFPHCYLPCFFSLSALFPILFLLFPVLFPYPSSLSLPLALPPQTSLPPSPRSASPQHARYTHLKRSESSLFCSAFIVRSFFFPNRPVRVCPTRELLSGLTREGGKGWGGRKRKEERGLEEGGREQL